MRKFEITFAQHSHEYDLYNAEKLVDDFLLKVNKSLYRRYEVTSHFPKTKK